MPRTRDQEPIRIEEVVERSTRQFGEELRKNYIAGETYDLLSNLLMRRGELDFNFIDSSRISRKFPDKEIPFLDSDRQTSYKIKIFSVMGKQIISPASFEIRYRKEDEKRSRRLFLVKRQKIMNSEKRQIRDIDDLKLARKIVRKIVKSAYRVFPIPPVDHDS